jgi:hypothetical protein
MSVCLCVCVFVCVCVCVKISFREEKRGVMDFMQTMPLLRLPVL